MSGVPNVGFHGCDGCAFGERGGCGVASQVAKSGINSNVQAGVVCSSGSIQYHVGSLTSPSGVLQSTVGTIVIVPQEPFGADHVVVEPPSILVCPGTVVHVSSQATKLDTE